MSDIKYGENVKLYGLPYKGSKSSIVDDIFEWLPKAEHFYDLFAGGCAVTHKAILSKKYKHIVFNDLCSGVTQLFLDAVNGKYKNEKRWISRDEFNEKKDTDPFIAYCWSFGNNGVDYLYGKDRENVKKALHYACAFDDYTLLEELGVNIKHTKKEDLHDRRIDIKNKIIKFYDDGNAGNLQSMQNLERIQNLERLERIQGLDLLESMQRTERIQNLETIKSKNKVILERSVGDYRDVKIEPNSIIYCDIPYIGIKGDKTRADYRTDKGMANDFSHDDFYDWCEKQSEPVFVSSYYMPEDRFNAIATFEKVNCLSATANFTVEEKLWIPKNQKYEKPSKTGVKLF